MKKYILLQSLLIFLFQCDSNSISISDNNQCYDTICEENNSNFLLQISVSMTPYDNQSFEEIVDSENYFGVHVDATDGYDANYDILESPNGPSSWVSLYFPHAEWNHPLGDNFTQDVKGSLFDSGSDKIVQWMFNVESNIYGTINLSFAAIDDYCYECIKSIKIILEDDIYTSYDMNFNEINISRFLQQNQILSFNLLVEFNQ